MMRQITALVAALFLCGQYFAASDAKAQNFPDRPIRIIVPFAAGGITDVIVRMMADRLKTELNQQVLIENITGAGGAVGTTRAAKSDPDGYTLVVATSTSMSIYPALKQNPTYDAERDFTPIAGFAGGQMMIAVPGSSAVRTIEEFIALSKQSPVTFGSAGVGTLPHLAAELMQRQTGAKLTHVPYRGNSAIVGDLFTGRLDSAYSMSEVMPSAKTNQIRILAVIGGKRDPQIPDVPTLKERGIDIELATWFAFYGPAGLPDAIVQKLFTAIKVAANDAEVARKLADLQVYVDIQSPAALNIRQQKEIAAFRLLRGTVTID